MQKLAIVILNFNGTQFLKQFLPSFIENSSNHTVYVVDNASTDDSKELVREHFPTVKLIAFDQNLGFTGGYNKALGQISATYYAIVNSDIEVSSGWVEPLLQILDSDKRIASCQPKILNQITRDSFDYAGASGGFIDQLGYPYCRGRVFDILEKDTAQYDDETDVFWTSGACMVIRSDAFHEAGGFDEKFFAHMEEIDLCWRLHRLGYRLKCIPHSVVYHVGGGTLNSANPKKTFLNFKNGFLLLIKNLPSNKLWILPLRWLLDILAAVKFLLEGNWKHSAAVLNAQLGILSMLPYYLSLRRKDAIPFGIKWKHQTKSLIIARYLQGKKKFTDLV